MVREIICVQVGQGGNQVGNSFWEAVCKEHALNTGEADKKKSGIFIEELAQDLDNDGVWDELEKVGVYFRSVDQTASNQNGETRYVPRAVIVDLEPGTVDVIRNSNLGHLYKPDNMVFGNNGAGNNWAKGHYTEGAELADEVMDALRREVEDADCPQGFQLTHSLGGGTGSGFGTLLLLKIRDNYPDRLTTSYSIFPSQTVSDTVVEPYNAVLSSHQLLENSDETFVIDNEALYIIGQNVLKLKQPSYAKLNSLISQTMCGITSSLRFPGQLNGDLRKLGVNLVPFPRLHFFLMAQAPFLDPTSSARTTLNVRELNTECWSGKNNLCNVTISDGKILAASLCFRGATVKTQVVEETTEKYQKKHEDDFVEWIPSNIKTSVISVAPKTSTMSATFVSNTTSLKGIFQRLTTQFGAMYRRKAFLHWYKNEGMDEMEFQEADKNVRDLITEYQDKQDAVFEEDEDEDEEESDEL